LKKPLVKDPGVLEPEPMPVLVLMNVPPEIGEMR
jgi:hypothetical protein